MKLIYKAKDIIEAHIISGLLESSNIESHVGGHYLQGGVGDLAASDFATLSVADNDVNEALLIIKGYEKKHTQEQTITKHGSKIFNVPIIVIALSIIMLVWLSIVFGDYS